MFMMAPLPTATAGLGCDPQASQTAGCTRLLGNDGRDVSVADGSVLGHDGGGTRIPNSN